jgi:hypothetical protein
LASFYILEADFFANVAIQLLLIKGMNKRTGSLDNVSQTMCSMGHFLLHLPKIVPYCSIFHKPKQETPDIKPLHVYFLVINLFKMTYPQYYVLKSGENDSRLVSLQAVFLKVDMWPHRSTWKSTWAGSTGCVT